MSTETTNPQLTLRPQFQESEVADEAKRRMIAERCKLVEHWLASLKYAPRSCAWKVATFVARVAGWDVLERSYIQIAQDKSVGFHRDTVRRACQELKSDGLFDICQAETKPKRGKCGMLIRLDRIAIQKFAESDVEPIVQPMVKPMVKPMGRPIVQPMQKPIVQPMGQRGIPCTHIPTPTTLCDSASESDQDVPAGGQQLSWFEIEKLVSDRGVTYATKAIKRCQARGQSPDAIASLLEGNQHVKGYDLAMHLIHGKALPTGPTAEQSQAKIKRQGRDMFDRIMYQTRGLPDEERQQRIRDKIPGQVLEMIGEVRKVSS